MYRQKENPLVKPIDVKASNTAYQVLGSFNPGAVMYKNEYILLMRVAENCIPEPGFVTIPFYDDNGANVIRIKKDHKDLVFKDTRGYFYKGKDYLSTISHLRIARSADGVNFIVDDQPFIYPTLPAESFGVEDARIVKIDGLYYINYTAVSGDGYVTMLATTNDFKSLSKKGIIFPPLNKDVALFPEMINGKYYALHRPDNKGFGLPSIWLSSSPDLLNWGHHECLLRPNGSLEESQKIGGNSSPIKTKKGWLVIYHAKGENSIYTLKVLLLDINDPSRIIGTGKKPVFGPEEEYEKNGFFPNVVFSNGVIEKNDGELFIYYGACDETVCLVKSSVSELLAFIQ